MVTEHFNDAAIGDAAAGALLDHSIKLLLERLQSRKPALHIRQLRKLHFEWFVRIFRRREGYHGARDDIRAKAESAAQMALSRGPAGSR